MKKSKKNKPTVRSRHEIVVRVEPQAILKPTDLAPIVDGGKFMIPKTWISEKQVIGMVQKTPPQFVLRRQGKGGKAFDYVSGHYVKRVLNFTFGWNWDFKIIKQEVFGMGETWAQVITLGELTVKDDSGHTITKADNGRADIKHLKETRIPMDLGNDFKASATDCLKRCAVQLGIAGDVYGNSEYREETGKEIRPAGKEMSVEEKHQKALAMISAIKTKKGLTETMNRVQKSKLYSAEQKEVLVNALMARAAELDK